MLIHVHWKGASQYFYPNRIQIKSAWNAHVVNQQYPTWLYSPKLMVQKDKQASQTSQPEQVNGTCQWECLLISLISLIWMCTLLSSSDLGWPASSELGPSLVSVLQAGAKGRPAGQDNQGVSATVCPAGRACPTPLQKTKARGLHLTSAQRKRATAAAFFWQSYKHPLPSNPWRWSSEINSAKTSSSLKSQLSN